MAQNPSQINTAENLKLEARCQIGKYGLRLVLFFFSVSLGVLSKLLGIQLSVVWSYVSKLFLCFRNVSTSLTNAHN